MLATALAGRYAMDHNHPDLRWETLDTERFAIHYPVSRRSEDHPRWLSGESTATRLARVADDTWLRLCTEIGYFPNERIHVVILEDTDRLRGFTLTQQDWIVFSGNPGPELARMRGRVDWVEDLLAHELAHVITLKKTGWLGEASESFGFETGALVEDGPNQLGFEVDLSSPVPHWWSEGAAEYWSERIGVNWWTPSRDMTLRTTIMGERLLGDEEWGTERFLEDWYDGERAYQQGYAFHRWFADRYGDAAWREVMERSGKRFRLQWEGIFEDVVGVPLPELKKAFEADLQAEVASQLESLRARGRVEGEELSVWELSWEAEDGWSRDWWALKPQDEREDQRESTGTLNLWTRYSPDGKWFGRQRSGWIEIRAIDEQMWGAFAGEPTDRAKTAAQRDRDRRLSTWIPSRYAGGLDFVPGRDEVITVGWEGEDRVRVTPERFTWTQLYRVDLTPTTQKRRHRGGRVEVETLEGSDARRRARMTAIPGTLRAMDPSVSPDGEWVAYTQYRDGSSNVWVSRLDGSERRALTTYSEGEWAAGTDWSPDGTQVVFGLHADHQQNLWVADVATGEARPLMRDRWEEVDPWWAEDGSLWFSADVDGVFDIFRRAPDGRIHRMTRVPTGAQSPSVTPDGNLIYTQLTGFGWKAFGLRRAHLAWEDATARFGDDGPDGEPGPAPEAASPRPYRPLRSLTGLAASPMVRLDRGFDGRVIPRVGAYLKVRDAVEVNTFTGWFWLGSDAFAHASWQWHRFWPDITVHGSHWAGRRSGDPSRRTLSSGGVGIELPWNDAFAIDFGLLGYTSRQEQDDAFARVLSSRVVSAGFRTGDAWELQRSNDARGIATRLLFSRGDSAGEQAYAYHRVEWSGQAVTDAAFGDGHAWVLDASVGLTDREVHREDALPIGGDHPYALRQEWVQRTTPMPGYAPYSSAGRHLAVTGLAWRFPLARELGTTIGPVVVDAIYGQIGGHAGVVWVNDRPPLLADGVVELRVASALWDSAWDSGFRFAYGAPTPDNPGGPRFSLSIGSGF
ncbi:MAG: PD40 domain-containing protein [Alphaproteobacteria bacterium]|nr:PD40 domain-containing protein [Alphaproteobacteria bacterium]